MTNEEKILDLLQAMQTDITSLKAGQVAMQTDIAGLKAGQVKLEAGQAKLEAGQVKLEAGQAKLEAGQDRLETKLMGEITGLASMLADTHEIIDAFRNETNKKLDTLNEEVTAVKRLTTRNIYDIAKLQEKIEEPAEA